MAHDAPCGRKQDEAEQGVREGCFSKALNSVLMMCWVEVVAIKSRSGPRAGSGSCAVCASDTKSANDASLVDGGVISAGKVDSGVSTTESATMLEAFVDVACANATLSRAVFAVRVGLHTPFDSYLFFRCVTDRGRGRGRGGRGSGRGREERSQKRGGMMSERSQRERRTRARCAGFSVVQNRHVEACCWEAMNVGNGYDTHSCAYCTHFPEEDVTWWITVVHGG